MIARKVSVERIWKTTAFLSLALALLCWLSSVGDAVSVLFGGAVSIVNLHLIRLLVSRLITPDAAGTRLSSLVATKLLILLALLAIALGRLPIEAASFLAGGTTLVVAVVLDALLLGEPADIEDEGAA